MAEYYKRSGISFMDLWNMDPAMQQILYKAFYEKMSTEEGKEEAAKEAQAEVIEEAVGIS
jgi:hypothetical protein